MRKVVAAVAFLGAIVLAVIASRIEIDAGACRTTDPMTAWFEPSSRGAIVDPAACSKAEATEGMRRTLLIIAAISAGIGILSLLVPRRAGPPPIDRGFA